MAERGAEDKQINYTHYVAIDFGTSGTGIALSTASNPDSIKVFSHWTTIKIAIDMKCPTVLLLDPEQRFEAFGEEAISLYHNKRNLKYPDRVADYYFFNQFKMSLYSRKKITSKLMIKAANGKALPATTVFATALAYIKGITLAKFEGFDNPSRKILWIVTVPAIWSLAAKQIMKVAAAQAGIGQPDNEDILFALEPEAAAIFCEKEILAVKKDAMENQADYLIVDCGGGTVDIAAHRLSKDDSNKMFIEELTAPQGGPDGGFSVNRAFEEMLYKLFKTIDEKQMEEIKTTYAREWTKLVYKEFEGTKTSFECNKPHQELSVTISERLTREIEKVTSRSMEDLIADCKEYKLSWDADENALVLKYQTMIRFFQPVVSQILARIEQILARSECKSIQTIVLVGGFAESSFLFEEVNDTFASKNITVIKSSIPMLSVLKGAVIFGQKRDVISSRKMSQSIGMKIAQIYNRDIHDLCEMEIVEGKSVCRNVYHQFIKANESVKAGSTVQFPFRALSTSSTTCKVDIYASTSNGIKYVTDDACYKLGEIIIQNPSFNYQGSYGIITVVMDLSGTDIKVMAYTQSSQEELKLSLNFVPEENYIPCT